VVKIDKIVKHPNADNLSIATISGDYPVVIKTDQYVEGQLVGYLAIDTIVPDIEDYYFLCPKAYEQYEEKGEIKQRQLGPKFLVGFVPERSRIIRAKKLRGVYSQGMLVDCPFGFKEGDDLVERFGLKKWEEEEEDNLPIIKSRGANAAPPPKGWGIPYYDLENVRRYSNCLIGEKDVILTEKIHGSNAAYCFDGENLVVKSRNFYKKSDPDDMWQDAALRNDIANKLSKYPMMVFFAELCGQVKGFRYSSEVIDGKLMTQLLFFDIYDLHTKRFVDYDCFKEIIDDIGLRTTPIIYRGPWLDNDTMYEMAERKTSLGGKHMAEGWVLSLGKERYEEKLSGRLKLKYVSKQYNLQK
jgi:RNA ligase (TIGR02306 family)